MDTEDGDGKSQVTTRPLCPERCADPTEPHGNPTALLTEAERTLFRLDGTAQDPSTQPSLERRAVARHPYITLHSGAAATETLHGTQADMDVETGHQVCCGVVLCVWWCGMLCGCCVACELGVGLFCAVWCVLCCMCGVSHVWCVCGVVSVCGDVAWHVCNVFVVCHVFVISVGCIVCRVSRVLSCLWAVVCCVCVVWFLCVEVCCVVWYGV